MRSQHQPCERTTHAMVGLNKRIDWATAAQRNECHSFQIFPNEAIFNANVTLPSNLFELQDKRCIGCCFPMALLPCKFSQSHRIGSGDLKTSFQDIHRVGHRSLRVIRNTMEKIKEKCVNQNHGQNPEKMCVCVESCIINGGLTQLKKSDYRKCWLIPSLHQSLLSGKWHCRSNLKMIALVLNWWFADWFLLMSKALGPRRDPVPMYFLWQQAPTWATNSSIITLQIASSLWIYKQKSLLL